MKTTMAMIVALALVMLAATGAMASSAANQTVTFEVGTINEISVSGNPASLAVNSATAGSQPTADIDESTTYSITTNGTSKKITGVLSGVMPSGLTLKIHLTAPTGGTSTDDTTLTTSAADLVTGITELAESEKGIEYILSATVSAGAVESAQRTVTLTVTDGGT